MIELKCKGCSTISDSKNWIISEWTAICPKCLQDPGFTIIPSSLPPEFLQYLKDKEEKIKL